MASRPNYANKCLIISLSERLEINLLSRIHYTTQSLVVPKLDSFGVQYFYTLQVELAISVGNHISKGRSSRKDLTRRSF